MKRKQAEAAAAGGPAQRHKQSLFATWTNSSKPVAVAGVPGLFLARDYISEEQEKSLLATIDKCEWQDDLKRKVQHYGFRYGYKDRNLEPLGPLPSFLHNIVDTMQADGIWPTDVAGSDQPSQAIVNAYEAGQGISAHIDHPKLFGEPIVSLSLGSPCVMEFTRDGASQDEGAKVKGAQAEEGAKDQNDKVDGTKGKGSKVPVMLPRRSLVILTGESRWQWKHSIASRKSDVYEGRKTVRDRRISITFRSVLQQPTKA